MKTIKTCVAIIFLISFSVALAQENATTKLQFTFDHYRKNTLLEKLFVHTDRTFYLTGETVWFKLYYTDASFNLPLNVSKVAYVEILDTEKKPVLQVKIALDSGNGHGSLFLPASLNSGHYTLRAYTNWMKNFDQQYFFRQTLTIVNPFQKLGLKPTLPTPRYDVQFFPEGGHLVAGLESVVAFRVADQNGKGAVFRGVILDENNDTITHFTPFKFGIGRFSFIPDKSHHYHAVIIDAQRRTTIHNLPSILDNGFIISVKDTTTEKILVTVKNKLSDQPINPALHLFLHTGQKNILTQTQFPQNGRAEFLLNKKDLAEGITHITIFDASLMPLCERLYYKEPERQLTITLNLEQTQYLARKKVRLDITTQTENHSEPKTDMSISVFRLDSLTTDNQQDIKSFTLLTSELKGSIESPSYYFQETTPEKLVALDNLMLTHGWSRFHWEDVLNEKKSYEFVPEIGGHIVHAKFTNIFTHEPAPHITTYFSTPGKVIRLYVARSDSNGITGYEMQDFYGSNDVIAQTNTYYDSIYQAEILSPFSEKKPTQILPVFDLSETLKKDLQERSIHMQVQNIFYDSLSNNFQLKTVDSIAFYGRPDYTYELDDYTRFPTMEEVMREYVPGVAVRKRKDGFHFLNFDEVNHAFFKENPLVLLDGIPMFDINKIMALDPRKVKTLDVLTRRYYYGPASFGGVVSYTTYKGDLAGFSPSTKSLITNYQGIQLQQDFFSPVYDLRKSNTTMPDTRHLLYWSPTVLSGSQGKCSVEFFTSDVIGKYQIKVEGISKDGKPATATMYFEVKEKLNY